MFPGVLQLQSQKRHPVTGETVQKDAHVLSLEDTPFIGYVFARALTF